MAVSKVLRMKTTDTAALYFRFLQMARSALTLPCGSDLSPLERQLLEEVFVCEYEHRPLTVKQAASLKHLASPSTLHKKLTRLRALQWLAVQHQGGDHRTKYLVLTPIAKQYFHSLDEAMHKAMAMHTRAVSRAPR
jgi:DNA-binding MarR family transcriptional regulator